LCASLPLSAISAVLPDINDGLTLSTVSTGDAIDFAQLDQDDRSDYSDRDLRAPLSVDDPGVDPTRIVALPKDDTSAKEVKDSIIDAADHFDAMPHITIVDNPGDADKETLVIVESKPEVTEDLRDKMYETGLYEVVDFDVKVSVGAYSSAPNDPYFSTKTGVAGSWGLHAFPGGGFSTVWPQLANTKGDANTAPVAVLDTGFDMSAADRQANIVAVYDFGSGRSNVNPESTLSLAYHGTGTAGLIAAGTNNGIGVPGAAWNNKVLIYKVADANNEIYLSAVTNAINDVVEKGEARIINMSLGGSSFPSYFQMAIDSAVAAGILVVASAGNYAQDGNPVTYPAAYPPVLSVASIGMAGQWSLFSTYNTGVDMAAPGEMITVMAAHNSYLQSSGTSYSAPYVSAAAALVWRAAPNLTAAQVQSILLGTAKTIGTRGNTKTGAGGLNVDEAFHLAQGLPFAPTITAVSRGANKVTLTWKRDSACPYPPTAYIVQIRPSTTTTWRTVLRVSSAAESYSQLITGLKENQLYYFRVATVNENGQGPYSTAVATKPAARVVLSSKSALTIKRGYAGTLRVATRYPIKASMRINWKSSNRNIATVSSTGTVARRVGAGYWNTYSLTTQAVASSGHLVTIVGTGRGTAYITFTSSYTSYRVKVVVK